MAASGVTHGRRAGLPLVLALWVRAMSGGVRVTATDLDHPEDSDSNEIMDNYVIVCAGTCDVSNVTVHHKSDGTTTHVITVKGIKP